MITWNEAEWCVFRAAIMRIDHPTHWLAADVIAESENLIEPFVILVLDRMVSIGVLKSELSSHWPGVRLYTINVDLPPTE